MNWLLDGNLLTALMLSGHCHHHRANLWFAHQTLPFATCSVTEGTFLRLSLRLVIGATPEASWAALAKFQSHPNHYFIESGFSYQHVNTDKLQGHKQVTDAWLAQLARLHSLTLATFDTGLVATHPDVAFLVP